MVVVSTWGAAAVPGAEPGSSKEAGVLADTVAMKRLPKQAVMLVKRMVKW